MITIEELAGKICRKPAAVMRMMKSRGYLDEDGNPSGWCIEGKIMSEDGRISKRGETLLVAELGIGKIPRAELEKFLSKADWWQCHGCLESFAFKPEEFYTADEIINRYYKLPNVSAEIVYQEDEESILVIGEYFFNGVKARQEDGVVIVPGIKHLYDRDSRV